MIKTSITILLFTSLFGVFTLHAGSFTLNLGFGVAKSNGGTPVVDGTLWALIVDSNDDSMLPGGLQTDSSLIAPNDFGSIFSDFGGKNILVGETFGGDTVFQIGSFNGTSFYGATGYLGDSVILTSDEDGLQVNRKFGFYWFPGILNYGLNTLPSSVFEVGGVQQLSSDMIVPGEGSTVNVAFETEAIGGTVVESRMQAVAVPELHSVVISMLSLVGFLLRRRN
jgi:hypothetical protein